MDRISIVIPAFNPDKKIFKLVSELIDAGFKKIIIIDDGSNEESVEIFKRLKNIDNCIILKHNKNLGKGRALKTGFNYFLKNCGDFIGLVTVDADGQHLVKDVVLLAKKMQKSNGKCLFLGSRDFNKNVPLRSKIGNELTKKLFLFLTGKNIEDTQTGLRAMPREIIKRIIKIKGDKYEYELKMLLELEKNGTSIKEESISTVYIDGNKSSHFRPFMDSIRVYYIFFKFILSSLSASFLDFILFWLIYNFSENIMHSLVIARILASFYNFIINKSAVFGAKEGYVGYFVKYYILLFGLLGVTYMFINIINSKLGLNIIIAKATIETILFFVSFYIQRKFIFYKK